MLTGRLPIGNVDPVNEVRRAEKTQKSKLDIRNSKQIQMIKKKNQTKADGLFATVYRFYSSLDLFRISSCGFRILPWHLWEGNRKTAALIEGAHYRNISPMGSGDGAG